MTTILSPSARTVLLCCCIAALVKGPALVRGSMATQRSLSWSSKMTKAATGFGIRQRNSDIHNLLLTNLRGGSSTVEEAEDEDEKVEEEGSEDEEEEEEEEDEEDIPSKVPSIASMEPVRLILSTNWGNPVIDHKVELTPARTRNIATIKKSLSKQLPGRPPIVAIEIVYEGRILDDETLVDELFEDEDEEEEDYDDEVEEGNEPSRKLTINILPPVDPKFATELGPKLLYHGDDDDDYDVGTAATIGDDESFTTEELINAYYMNQVAMSRNAQLLADPNVPSSPFLRMELQEQAMQLKEQLQSETPAEVWEKCMSVPTKKGNGHSREEWRGQRYRSGKGGVKTQLMTTVQTNLNVNWEDAIKQSILFLFLGYFGGKNSFSRHLLLWGAPLSFALQARPVKMWFKTIFYMMSNPPLILLSFLPAPQQAILSMDLKKSVVALYGEEGAKSMLGTMFTEAEEADETTSTISADEEDESDAKDETDEEDEDEYDSEEEEESDSDEE